jgi:uncharacterized protein (DUF885 family)
MIDRRTLLTTSVAAGAAAALPAFAQTQAKPVGDPALNALFDAFFQENLRRNPEGATQLGLDKGANADLKSKLTDRGPDERARNQAENADQLKRLQAIDRKRLSGADAVNYDTVLYALNTNKRLLAFDFGGRSYGPSPYAISQLTGAYQSIPDFLDTKHRIETKADADAYLSRMEQYATVLDQETVRFQHDTGQGIVPADFLLDATITQMSQGRTDAASNKLVTSIATRAAAKGLGDRYGQDAARLYETKVSPAMDRQLEAVKAVRAHAQHQPGVWRFKEGDAFYAACLQSATTTRMTPEEIHKVGLEQGREVTARCDALFKKQGMTKGTVGERIQGLFKDPSQIYANDPAGKAKLIAYCNKRLDDIRAQLPRAFHRIPPYRFEVRAVPSDIDTGAPGAYSQTPSLDGRPGIVYFNLHDPAEWPRWSLDTTVFHEGLPGHQMEGGLALSNTSLPLIRKTMGFSAYGEGWALYAEQLAQELGMYENDPLGEIGWLKGQLFRCGRLVVDTGMHHFKWSREKAIDYLTGLDGDAIGFTTREVDRYCSIPGQATAYKTGHNVWIRARARAEKALGPKYDIKDFHDAGLGCGRVPLDVLDGVIDRWIAAAKV